MLCERLHKERTDVVLEPSMVLGAGPTGSSGPRPAAVPGTSGRPEPIRERQVPGTWGYVDRIGIKPGESVRFHLSAPAAYDFSVVRLGTRALLDPDADDQADRADVEMLYSSRHAAAEPRPISPGSYVYVDGRPIPAGPLALSTWLRLWRLPVINTVQWDWAGIITDLDYPEASRFGLLVDHVGRVAVYAGDGTLFRHQWLHCVDVSLAGRLGQWVHLLASIHPSGVGIWVDGDPVYRSGLTVPVSEPGASARLRIGASAERGAANNFLDGDIAAPFVGRLAAGSALARRLTADRGRADLADLGVGELLAYWPLDEERGTRLADRSGHGRHGQIVNHATWQIGGPAHDPSRGLPWSVPPYDPTTDPERGHGLRFNSDDLVDCGWPVSEAFEIPPEAASGLYAGRVCLVGQGASAALTIPFAVVRPRPRRENALALLLATNTWYAYGSRPTDGVRIDGLSASLYSTHRSGLPFFHVGTRVPMPLIDPYGFDSPRAGYLKHSHLVRPERFAQAWLEREGYAHECIADGDLHADPALLRDFRALLICGHSEYWTDTMRDGLLAYLRSGGRVLSLSGDTMSQRISWNEDQTVLEARKCVPRDDPRWLPPARWGERWHSDGSGPGGTFRSVGRPSYEVLGLSTQGMIDDGTPTSFAPLQVLRPDHFLFNRPERVPITPSGTIGERGLNGPRASGYEFDASPQTIGLTLEPMPGAVTLASALGQRNIEWIGNDPYHGADVIYWERPDGGQVVNAGSIAMTGALAVDPGVQALVRNALHHFGVARSRRNGPGR
jgi:N,N-dimethylformamidase